MKVNRDKDTVINRENTKILSRKLPTQTNTICQENCSTNLISSPINQRDNSINLLHNETILCKSTMV